MKTSIKKNSKKRPVNNNEFEQYYSDPILRKKIYYTIRQKSLAFERDQIEDIIADGMMRGLSYYRDQYKKTIDTNIVQFIMYGILNAYRNKKVKDRKIERIKRHYIEHTNHEYTNNDTDLLLDIECLPEIHKNVAKHLLSGDSKTKIKQVLKIDDKKLKNALSNIARCILGSGKINKET